MVAQQGPKLRLRGLLRAGEWSAVGQVLELGERVLRMELGPGAQESSVLALGGVLDLTLPLPDATRPLHVTAEVQRLELSQDGGCALELRVGGKGAWTERLARFVHRHKPMVLIVEPVSEDAQAFRRALEGEYRVVTVSTADQAWRHFVSGEVSALVVSDEVEDLSCVELLRRAAQQNPRLQVARLVSFRPGAPASPQVLDAGPGLYHLKKPFRLSELQQVLRRGVEAFSLSLENELLRAELERVHARLARENRYLKQQAQLSQAFSNLVGKSPALREALAVLERVGRTDAAVHLSGETGTGKDVVARALHAQGARAQGPYVAQNCGGLSEALLQSTLFGHKKGAFTGADRDHAGVFERASGGTLFLDEVAELSLPMQAALLRVLQEGEVTPLGADRPVQVDVRLLSATHKSLREEVALGRFREDLYFRLVVVAVELPPLRAREGDIPLLAHHLLALHCERQSRNIPGFESTTLAALERYPWPGNVRQLENEVERMVVLADDGRPLGPELLSAELREALGLSGEQPGPADPGLWLSSDLTYDEAHDALARSLVQDALDKSEGRLKVAAERLEMDRSRLGKLRLRLGLARGDERGDDQEDE